MKNDAPPQGALAALVQTLVELNLITEPIEPIKSGKEASVYRAASHPDSILDSHHEALAIKAYRPRSERSFKNDARYREGSMIYRIGGGNTRAARALRAGTRFGRQVQAFTWEGHEWEVLQALYAAGLPVPEPIYSVPGAIVMELFCEADGRVAPPLERARLSADQAAWLFAAVCDDIEQMLGLNLLHGDLSPYNILWNGEGYRIIDFPQAVDPRFHGSAQALLQRDIQNIARFCARFVELPDAGAVSDAMWERYQRGE